MVLGIDRTWEISSAAHLQIQVRIGAHGLDAHAVLRTSERASVPPMRVRSDSTVKEHGAGSRLIAQVLRRTKAFLAFVPVDAGRSLGQLGQDLPRSEPGRERKRGRSQAARARRAPVRLSGSRRKTLAEDALGLLPVPLPP